MNIIRATIGILSILDQCLFGTDDDDDVNLTEIRAIVTNNGTSVRQDRGRISG